VVIKLATDSYSRSGDEYRCRNCTENEM